MDGSTREQVGVLCLSAELFHDQHHHHRQRRHDDFIALIMITLIYNSIVITIITFISATIIASISNFVVFPQYNPMYKVPEIH